MEKVKTILCLLVNLFVGLIIGGAIANNTAAWVSGLVLLIVDVFAIVAMQKKLKPRASDFHKQSSINIISYVNRVNRITNSTTEYASFMPSEIVSATVNLLDAKKYLSKEEYYFVSLVFNTYKSKTNTLLLNYDKYLVLCYEIMAHFDLIAPYYKFCGDRGSQLAMLMACEDEKIPYRQKAQKLLKEGKIFKEDWMKLHEDFLMECYFKFY